jgi:hypothetical protein
MSELLADFERACKDAGIEPTDALRAGGVHPTLWLKWTRSKGGPTLRNFEAARAGLRVLVRQRQAASETGAAA